MPDEKKAQASRKQEAENTKRFKKASCISLVGGVTKLVNRALQGTRVGVVKAEVWGGIVGM